MGEETGEYELAEPLPTGINPKAAVATYDLELGSSKVFTSRLTVKQAKKDWLPVGTEIVVTSTVKKTANDLSKLEGLPKTMILPKIKADAAYEISVIGAGGVPASKFGMTKKTVFYVDADAKKFSAIALFMEPAQTDAPVKFPPVVMIPVEE